MSANGIRFLAPVICVILFAGCGTISRDRYINDIQSLKDYSQALERRNQELESEIAGYKKLADEASLVSRENQFYDRVARRIEDWIRNNEIDSSDVYFDIKAGKWIMKNDVLFQSGSYIISQKGGKILKTIAGAYSKNDIRLRIVGHTDRDPVAKKKTMRSLPVTGKLNLELSALRAVAVAFELRKHGIGEKRMFVEGHGNNNPVAANDNRPENKRRNRRVEIFILEDAAGK